MNCWATTHDTMTMSKLSDHIIEHDIFLDDNELALKEDLWYNLCRLNDLDTTMKEFTLTIKDVEGDTQDIKTFAKSIAGVIENMINIDIVEAIGRVVCSEDGKAWDMQFQSLAQLRKNRNDMYNLGLQKEYQEVISKLEDDFLDKQ